MKFLQEGFPAQILVRCPREAVQRMRKLPLARTLHFTDIGCYPEARQHRVERTGGANGHILIYCSAGHGWCILNGSRHPLNTAQALLIPARTPHAYGSEDNSYWKIHWIHFEGSEADAAFELLRESPDQPVIYVPKVKRITDAFEDCLSWTSGGYSDDVIVAMSGTLSRLIALLYQSRRALGSAARAAEDRIRFSVDQMKNNLAAPLDLSQLAATTALSIPHYCALFRKYLGTTPIRLYTFLRIQRACVLLHSTQLPIGEIAQLTGYEDPYYFSRTFRKTMGVSPSTYRAEHEEPNR